MLQRNLDYRFIWLVLLFISACGLGGSRLAPDHGDDATASDDGMAPTNSDASLLSDGGVAYASDRASSADRTSLEATGVADAASREISIASDEPGEPTDAGADASVGSGCIALPEGEQVVSIAGTWSFTPSGGGAARTIEVPGGGWVAQGFRVLGGRYETSVTIPDLGHAQSTLIEFGAVNHQATLSLDGAMVGSQTTSFTPSVFDVTRYATPGRMQSLVVDVLGRDGLHDPVSGRKLVPDAAGWSAFIPQGIYRSAVVRAVPQLFISDVFVRPSIGDDTIRVDVSVTNTGAAAATASIATTLKSWNCEAWPYPSLPSTQVTVAPMSVATVTVGPVQWGLGPSSYWWPNVPYKTGYKSELHYAVVRLAAADGTMHTRPARFGFREVRQAGTHYELNGVRVNFRGDNLQGANYDSIRIGNAPTDAYDRLPGFLPPSTANRGWPQAVDNYQKLNYNVVRIHQEPASPYMLDTLDEMGLMVIDETAIRGTSQDQDFVLGASNMLGHARGLVLRDRNHPCIVRWSQCNEPEYDPTNSVGFQQQLYDTITAADPTRPVSADSGFNGPGFDRSFTTLASTPNFAVYPHYPGGIGMYTETVLASATRPFGVGEYIWPKDNSAQGLAWFATSTMAMRQQDASDLRPYTLLSGWSSFVPGVVRTTMTIEQGGNPLFGVDNLPDPWSNAILIRIERAFHPVLVADIAYWAANRMSDATGAWPTSVPTVAHGAALPIQLLVFNDTFADTGVDVGWELHQDGATGAITSQGQMHVDIALGGHSQVPIMVTMPVAGTSAYLVLTSGKRGQELFREDSERFMLQ